MLPKMLRQIFFGSLVVIFSIGGGAWSVDYALRQFGGFGQLQIGQWQAFPQSGTQQADPYARARALKFEMVALGRAEGLSFSLWRDDKGKKLHVACSYRLEGNIPEAGFFTLYAVDGDLRPKKNQMGRPYIVNSDNVLRRAKGDYLILLSPQAQSGNWLSVEQNDPDEAAEYGLVLTLYDTPIITTTGMNSLDMPHLTRIDGADSAGGEASRDRGNEGSGHGGNCD